MPRRRTALAGLTGAALIMLTACSGGDGGPRQKEPSLSAATVAEEVARAVGGLTVALPGNFEPEGPLGQTHGYLSAAVVQDPSLPTCNDDLNEEADCGAVVEQWPDADAAAARSGYLLGLYRDGQLVGSERHLIEGAILLRIWGELPEERSDEYAVAFTEE